jgi:hypothetical protein
VAETATLNVDSGVNVLIGEGSILTVNGTLDVTAPASFQVSKNDEFATAGIVVNGTMSASNVDFTNLGNGSFDTTKIEVKSGGGITASDCTFALDNFMLDEGSKLQAGDLTGNTFSSSVFTPSADLPLLAGSDGNANASFQNVEIDANDTLPSGQTISFTANLGSNGSPNLVYVIQDGGNPGQGFTVAQGATLNVDSGVNVLIRQGAILTDSGTLNITAAASFQVEDKSLFFGTTTGIIVNGTMAASNTNFSRENNSDGIDTTKIEVKSGGSFTASLCSFALDELNLDAGSTDTIQFGYFITQLNVNSAATLAFSDNDLSNSLASVVASGAKGSQINLANNYWGTTDPSSKITANGVTVIVKPLLYPEKPAEIVAQDASAVFNAASQDISLSAIVLSPSGVVNEGTATFMLLDNGGTIGNPEMGDVVDGIVSVTYVLPGGQAGGTYTIQAIYSGTSNFISWTDSSHTLVVSPASTTTVAASVTATFRGTAGLSAMVSSPNGTVSEGTVTFTILNGGTTVGSAGAHVFGGVAILDYPLPASALPGSYSIDAVYNGTNDYTTSMDSTQSLTINPAPFSQLAVSVSPLLTAGESATLTVTAEDAFGDIISSYGGSVQFQSSDSQWTSPGSYTFMGGDGGVHQFAFTLRTAGAETVSVMDQSAGITGQTSIQVLAAAASRLTVSVAAPVYAAIPTQVTVSALDPFNNIATSYAGTIHLSNSDQASVFPRSYSFTAGDQGVHVFTFAFNTVGQQSLAVVDQVNMITSGKVHVTVLPNPNSVFIGQVYHDLLGRNLDHANIVRAYDADQVGNLHLKLGNTVPGSDRQTNRGEIARGRTVILGTFHWDVETDRQGAVKGADLWWDQGYEGKQFLVPLNGARIAVLGTPAFVEISRADLLNVTYSPNKVPNTSLAPGTVLALRTTEGNFAKLRVVRYRESHDVSFPEAKTMRPESRALRLDRPNIRNYHLEVEWVLYPKKDPNLPVYAEQVTERIEAEALPVKAGPGCRTFIQDMVRFGRTRWSGGTQLLCIANEGGFVEMSFPVARTGRYRVRVLATTAPDYAKLLTFLDNKTITPDFDLYGATVLPSDPLELGTHELAAGSHQLRFLVIGRNPASTGYRFGIDAIEFLLPDGARSRSPSEVDSGGGNWRIDGQELAVDSPGTVDHIPTALSSFLAFGDPSWKNYDVTLEARRTGGENGFAVFFRVANADNRYVFALGSYKNTGHDVARIVNGSYARDDMGPRLYIPGSIQLGRWYNVRCEVRGDTYRCYLNDQLLFKFTDSHLTTGRIALGTYGQASARFRGIKVTDPDGNLLWKGLPRLEPTDYSRDRDEKWIRQVWAMPVEKQVAAIAEKMKERNPGFDGQVHAKIDNGPIVELTFPTDAVDDISPLRALPTLPRLYLTTLSRQGKLKDLTPLHEMSLTHLSLFGCSRLRDLAPLEGLQLVRLDAGACRQLEDLTPLHGMPLSFLELWHCDRVRDLSPLQGMPLVHLNLNGCVRVQDLMPLHGMPLTWLSIYDCDQIRDLMPLEGMRLTFLEIAHCKQVSDPGPLKGMKLTFLNLNGCSWVRDLKLLQGMKLEWLDLGDCGEVQDLTPLQDMPLKWLGLGGCSRLHDLRPLQGMELEFIYFTPKNIRTGLEVLRQMKSLKKIGLHWTADRQFSAKEFWRRYDAGEFK